MSAPRTMQAVVTRGHGGLEMLDVTEVPVPAPGAGEVLVRIGACGMNNTDIWTREGAYGTDRDPHAVTGTGRRPGRFPIVQGCDVAGTVAALGEGVDPRRLGERVLCNFVLYPRTPRDDPSGLGFVGGLGSSRDGGYAEYTTVPAANAYPVGDTALTDPELATFPCAYITAEHMLSAASVAAGETVLVTGASGGAGSALVQLATLRGARVVAVTSGAWKDAVASLGPHAVVLRDAGDLVEQVGAALDGGAVEVVADVVGGSGFADYLALLGPHGRYVSAGAMAGPLVDFDLRTMYLKGLRLIGVSIGLQHHFESVLAQVLAGRLRPLLARTFPLSQVRAAQEFFTSKAFFGKIVLLPGS